MNSGILSGVIIKEIGCGPEPMQNDMKIVDLDLSWFNCLPRRSSRQPVYELSLRLTQSLANRLCNPVPFRIPADSAPVYDSTTNAAYRPL
jgi:hypothetical protein